MNRAFLVLLLSGATASLAAQSVLNVGPNATYPDIQSAILAAAPGDVILIAPGTYQPFTLDRALTLRTDSPGGAVTVTGDTLTGVTVHLAASAHARIDGLYFLGRIDLAPPSGAAQGGVLSMTDVVAESPLSVLGSNLVLTNCECVGPLTNGVGFAGITLNGGSALSASGCAIHGTHTTSFLVGGAGIEAANSSVVHLSNCTVVGGDSVSHVSVLLGSALALRDQARAWVVDSDLSVLPTMLAAPAIVVANTSSSPVLLERCTLDNGGALVPLTSGAVLNHLLLGISTPNAVVAPGGTVQVDFRTQPGLFVAYHVSFTVTAPNANPLLAELEWGFLASSLFLGFLQPDPQGLATAVLPIPNLPGITHLPLWFCGWTATDLPVEVSPLAAVVLR